MITLTIFLLLHLKFKEKPFTTAQKVWSVIAIFNNLVLIVFILVSMFHVKLGDGWHFVRLLNGKKEEMSTLVSTLLYLLLWWLFTGLAAASNVALVEVMLLISYYFLPFIKREWGCEKYLKEELTPIMICSFFTSIASVFILIVLCAFNIIVL